MSSGALRFLQPLSFRGVTGREVYTDMFEGSGPAAHIRLGMEAEAVVVAPATANFLARAAQGSANDLLTTTLLVTRAPVLLCPAMNDRMYSHPQTQENVRHLGEAIGYRILGPAQGPLAFGEGTGHGRMLESEEIVQHVGRALGAQAPWEGRHVVVTAGPTREPLDPVRFLGNRSSGRMGFALASAAWRRGASVKLVSGPSALPDPPGIDVIRVETGEEMRERVHASLPQADVLVFAAAVSDFRPEEASDQKLKRSRKGEGMEVRLAPTPDIALSTLEGRKTGAVALGFALETQDLLSNARKKLKEKGFHLIAANSASESDAGFDVDTNRVTILDTDGGVEELPVLPKDDVAEKLLDRLTRFLQGGA
jgi:phosphopantothenoylcysteine decarboxylase/phosphopantothenate--cysteine ligase